MSLELASLDEQDRIGLSLWFVEIKSGRLGGSINIHLWFNEIGAS